MNLSPQLLIKAYSAGIFPMAEEKENEKIFWVDPKLRGIFPLHSIHIPKSLIKKIKKTPFKITFNKDFFQVINSCAAITKNRSSTWINKEIISTYYKLFQEGFAHSVEAWEKNKLVGGLYGVSIKGAFFGESMFSIASDSSKISLMYLICYLKKSGFHLLDTQFFTNHLSNFGAIEVSRDEYHKLLKEALKYNPAPPNSNTYFDFETVLQSITQTS